MLCALSVGARRASFIVELPRSKGDVRHRPQVSIVGVNKGPRRPMGGVEGRLSTTLRAAHAHSDLLIEPPPRWHLTSSRPKGGKAGITSRTPSSLGGKRAAFPSDRAAPQKRKPPLTLRRPPVLPVGSFPSPSTIPS